MLEEDKFSSVEAKAFVKTWIIKALECLKLPNPDINVALGHLRVVQGPHIEETGVANLNEQILDVIKKLVEIQKQNNPSAKKIRDVIRGLERLQESF